MYDFERVLAEYKIEFGDDIEGDLDLKVSGWDFLERVVFGFVRANPIPRTKPVQRVSAIMRLLTGTSRIFPAAVFDDEDALLAMAHAHNSDLRIEAADPNRKPRSPLELARVFAHAAGGDLHAAVERLNDKFKTREVELLENVDDRRVAIEVLQRFAMEDLERPLGQFGIKFFAYE